MASLKAMRKGAGLSQKELGVSVFKKTGRKVMPSTAQLHVSHWELGKSKPGPKEMNALTQVLNADEAAITGFFGESSHKRKLDNLVPNFEILKISKENWLLISQNETLREMAAQLIEDACSEFRDFVQGFRRSAKKPGN